MSLILDALRKMEQDRKNRRGAGGDLRPEVLRYRGDVTSPSAKPYLLAAAGAVLLVVGVGAGFLIRGHGDGETLPTGREAAATQSAAGETSTPPATVAAAPVAPGYPGAAAATSAGQPPATEANPAAAIAHPEVPSGASAAAPAPTATTQPARAQARVAAPARPAPKPVSASHSSPSASPAANGSAAASSTVPPATAKKSRKTATASSSPAQGVQEGPSRRARQDAQQPVQVGAADITISGIAWQEERNLRRAVLNGSLVGEGATVSGARVVEIQETRVRLSRNGRLFDLVLSSMPR